MKKQITLIMLALVCTVQAGAQKLAMQEALEKFVNDKSEDVKITVGVNNIGTDDDGFALNENAKWKISAYEFKVRTLTSADIAKTPEEIWTFEELDNAQKAIYKNVRAKLGKVIAAYEKDTKRKDVTFALHTQGVTPNTYKIRYSNKEDLGPLAIGGNDNRPNLLVISANNKPGRNTVCVLQFKDNTDDLGNIDIEGQILILERSTKFANLTVEKDEERIRQEYAKESADVRRLKFYAEKYCNEEGYAGGSEAIVMAVETIVKDIKRHNNPMEIDEAKKYIDQMIAATPSPNRFGSIATRNAVAEKSERLNNALKSLTYEVEYQGTLPYVDSSKTFRLNGTIDEGLWDMGYFISMSDETMGDPTNETQLVKADGQNFQFQMELDGIRYGRVRALMKDGTICSAWIEILFVPGETAVLNVHNGTYSLGGTGFYEQYDKTQLYLATAGYYSGETPEERTENVLKMLKEHANEPGVFVYVFKEEILTNKEDLQKAYNLLPDELKQSQYGVFLRRFL